MRWKIVLLLCLLVLAIKVFFDGPLKDTVAPLAPVNTIQTVLSDNAQIELKVDEKPERNKTNQSVKSNNVEDVSSQISYEEASSLYHQIQLDTKYFTMDVVRNRPEILQYAMSEDDALAFVQSGGLVLKYRNHETKKSFLIPCPADLMDELWQMNQEARRILNTDAMIAKTMKRLKNSTAVTFDRRKDDLGIVGRDVNGDVVVFSWEFIPGWPALGAFPPE